MSTPILPTLVTSLPPIEWPTCGACGHPTFDDGCACAVTYADEPYWPVNTGLAIRRFVRRAEVGELVAQILSDFDHSSHCRKRFVDECTCVCQRSVTDLDRLAALAMEGS